MITPTNSAATPDKINQTAVQATTSPDADSELSGTQLDSVSGGLAPNLSSMMKALWKSKGPAQAEQNGRPMSNQAFASHGAATKA